MAKVVLFEDINFGGDQKVLYTSDNNLDEWGWWDFNDEVSSFIVEEGNAQFFSNPNYGGWASRDFGPGERVAWVEEVGIGNDSISSVELWG